MSYLKTCPFCGSDVEIIPEGDYCEINCDTCQCSMCGNTYHDLEVTWNERVVE